MFGLGVLFHLRVLVLRSFVIKGGVAGSVGLGGFGCVGRIVFVRV